MDGNLEKIYQSFVKLLEPISTDNVYKTIVDEARSLVDAEYGSVLLAKGDGRFEIVYTNIPKRFRQLKYRRRGYVYRTFKKRWLQILSNEELSAVHPEFRNKKIKSVILIPLSFNQISIGVLSLQSTKIRHFTQKRRNILKLFGSMATLKIKNSQLLREKDVALAGRDLFISMASHELRTPLTTIQGYAKLIGANIKSKKSVKNKWVDILDNEIERMARIVRELLNIDFIRKGRFRYNMDEFKLSALIDRTEKNYFYSFPKRKFKVECLVDCSQKIWGDIEKLQQVLDNIISNAVKFSFENTPIKFLIKEKNSDFIFEVINSGIGIKKSDLPNIFENFYKGDPDRPGMGLGLYIAKTIIDDHGGDIKAKSKVDDKTTLTVILPKVQKNGH